MGFNSGFKGLNRNIDLLGEEYKADQDVQNRSLKPVNGLSCLIHKYKKKLISVNNKLLNIHLSAFPVMMRLPRPVSSSDQSLHSSVHTLVPFSPSDIPCFSLPRSFSISGSSTVHSCTLLSHMLFSLPCFSCSSRMSLLSVTLKFSL